MLYKCLVLTFLIFDETNYKKTMKIVWLRVGLLFSNWREEDGEHEHKQNMIGIPVVIHWENKRIFWFNRYI